MRAKLRGAVRAKAKNRAAAREGKKGVMPKGISTIKA